MLWCVVMVIMVAETVLAQYQFVEVGTPSFGEDEAFNQVQQKLEELMQTEREYMDQRINQITSEDGDLDQLLNLMETRLEESTNTIVTEILDPLVAKVEAGLERDRMVEAITGLETRLEEKFEGTEEKLDEMRMNITNHLVRGATHEDLIQMKSSLSTAVISSISQATTAIADLVTVEKLEEVLVAELEVVREGCSRCGQQDTLTQVSAAVTNVQDHFYLLGQQLNTTLSSCSQDCEAVQQEVSTVVDERCSVSATLTQSVDSLEIDLGYILNTVDHIHTYTQPRPEPTTTTAPSPQPVQVIVRPKTPCEDSTFVASEFNVCAAAVRFRKCNLLALSYHCCHTCYTAGHIHEEGPWRYLNYPRQINTIQGFQLLRTAYNH